MWIDVLTFPATTTAAYILTRSRQRAEPGGAVPLSAALTRELEDVVAALDTRVPRTAGDPKQTWGR